MGDTQNMEQIRKKIEDLNTYIGQMNKQITPAPLKPLLNTLYNRNITKVPTCIILPNTNKGTQWKLPNGNLHNLPKFHGLSHERPFNNISELLSHCALYNKSYYRTYALCWCVFPFL